LLYPLKGGWSRTKSIATEGCWRTFEGLLGIKNHYNPMKIREIIYFRMLNIPAIFA